ncbi:NADPH:quinone reductase [Pseudorhodoferax sp.]|uniref:NADPH:quinone reductase n=1 Tax=Pseudorhodoferax sp. TaxID=1993553 RepID=UPI0039E36238
MRAAWYDRHGPARTVLQVGDLAPPEPAAGEVRVRIHWSGVNRSDVKRRARPGAQDAGFTRLVPHMDGSGVIDRVGRGVDPQRIGQRVWLHRAACRRAFGTAAEYTVVPQRRAVPLPQGVDLQAGATLGVPALTAHRALLGLGPVRGQTVLVTGGAGSVGFYAIQLARWAGARQVLATASGDAKGRQALRAGAHAVVDRRREDVAARVRALTGGAGVDHVVEVDFGGNLPHTLQLLKPHGSIASYASMGEPNPTLPFYEVMPRNWRMLFVALYELPQDVQDAACADLTDWLRATDLRLPELHVFGLDEIAAAHERVEAGAPGKVLLRIATEA